MEEQETPRPPEGGPPVDRGVRKWRIHRRIVWDR